MHIILCGQVQSQIVARFWLAVVGLLLCCGYMASKLYKVSKVSSKVSPRSSCILYLAVLQAIWQSCWLSRSAAGYLALLMAFWQCCQLFGSAANYFAVQLAVLQTIWQCCWLSGSAIWQLRRLYNSDVNYLAVLLTNWQTIWQWNQIS